MRGCVERRPRTRSERVSVHRRRLHSRVATATCTLPIAVLALALLASPAALSADPSSSADPSRDPGLVLELDRSHYRVSVRDARSGETGPSVPVVLGSPANPTPAGRYPVAWVILHPAWQPGEGALAAGARPEPSSLDTPMGVAKIPFADHGSIALHGGGDRRLLGRSVSGGCVRAADADMLRLIAWLDLHAALGLPTLSPNGELRRPFQRPAHVLVR